MKILSLLGGGIDSTTLTIWLKTQGHDVTAFWVNYGQVAARNEYDSCSEFCSSAGIDLETASLMMDMGSSSIVNSETDKNDRTKNVLDGRNAILLSMGTSFAANHGFEAVAIGYHHEPDKVFPDACIPFFDQYSKLMEVGLVNPVKLIAPFRNLLRYELFMLADSIDTSIVDHTHTCYDNIIGGCGKCSHCIQKASYVRSVTLESVLKSIRSRIDL
jgi:7-cyano-7-deazaguanine synthase